MNFKTTYTLLGLLVVAGLLYFLLPSGNKSNPSQSNPPVLSASEGPKLFSIDSTQIKSLSIDAANGTHTTLEQSNGVWKMTEPVKAMAVDYSTRDLLDSIVSIKSQGRPTDTSDAGFDKPRYHIVITTNDGKTTTLDIGNITGAGDVMYARVNNGDINLIPSTLDKTLKTAADTIRDKRLIAGIQSSDIKQFRITFGGKTLAAALVDRNWQIVDPTQLPGDNDTITQLLNTILGVEATEFVKSDSPELPLAKFDKPTMQVWLSTDKPTTQPSTTVPSNPTGGVTLLIGGPDSLAADHYYAEMADGTIAKISSDSLKLMQKTPLDLRDRAVATIPPINVTRVSILKQTFPPPPPPPAAPATTEASTQGSTTAPAPAAPIVVAVPPATQPTSEKTMVLVKRPPPPPAVMGPPMPASRPTTVATTEGATTNPATMASTEPATQPAPQSTWQLADDAKADLDDGRVGDLLGQFSPLRADKWVESMPTTGIVTKYIIDITEQPAGSGSPIVQHIEIVKPASDPNYTASYNGMFFQVPSTLIDALDADYHKSATPPALPPNMQGMPPGGFGM